MLRFSAVCIIFYFSNIGESVMAAFIVSIVRVIDPEGFKPYSAKIAGLAETFGGEYVARGPVIETLEGTSAPGERVVVVRFPDSASARAYIDSPTYREGKALRQGAGEVSMRLIEG